MPRSFQNLTSSQVFGKLALNAQKDTKPHFASLMLIINGQFYLSAWKLPPSIFQKAMVKIFQPILHHALIYIDDILFFSGTHEEHRKLLNQFFDIIQTYGIMLSAKKSIIATDNIEFLELIIKYGHYQPRKHIAQELLHFPYQQLTKKQIQQFLCIINYIRDFIPHVDHHTNQLSALLKKKPPEWNDNHTLVVTTLKKIAQNPPPLKLITYGKLIL